MSCIPDFFFQGFPPWHTCTFPCKKLATFFLELALYSNLRSFACVLNATQEIALWKSFIITLWKMQKIV